MVENRTADVVVAAINLRVTLVERKTALVLPWSFHSAINRHTSTVAK